MKKIQGKEKHEKYWQQEKLIKFNEYERNQVLSKLFIKEEKLLDLGCGDGAVAEYIRKNQNSFVVGVDFSSTAANRARKRGVTVVVANAESKLPLKSNTFETVFFGDVIEHIYNPETAIKEIWRVLKPSGRVIISCPNMGYWRYRVHYLLKGIFPETEWITQELWESQHIRFFNKNLLYKLLEKKGFKPTKFIGVSRRRLDQPLLNIFPELFGMIMVGVFDKL